jgi:hypothetical protein
MREEEFFGRRIWAHFLRREAPQKTGLSAAIFFAASPQKRISASIPLRAKGLPEDGGKQAAGNCRRQFPGVQAGADGLRQSAGV